MSDLNIDKIKSYLETIAQENVTIVTTPAYIYAYGSELAVLRLFAKYQTNGKYWNKKATLINENKSEELIFCLEVN